jgi:acylphosphatase
MKKCLRISFSAQIPDNFLTAIILPHARTLEIEGTAQISPDQTVKIIACGEKDIVDSFVDIIHKETSKLQIDQVEIIPFIKDREYRGVFRILE